MPNHPFESIRDYWVLRFPRHKGFNSQHIEFRSGDACHSLADIADARHLLGRQPGHRIGIELRNAMEWYVYNYGCTS